MAELRKNCSELKLQLNIAQKKRAILELENKQKDELLIQIQAASSCI